MLGKTNETNGTHGTNRTLIFKLIFLCKPIMLTRMRPAISEGLCENCGECIDTCPYDVFGDLEGVVAVVNPQECIECTACIDTCPQKAISMDN